MTTARPPRKTRVFLVEDDDDTRQLLVYLLEALGFEVASAPTMKAALDAFPASDSDVLVSDLGLPDGDGCELLRRLAERGIHPYAIAMTGFGSSADAAASRAGFRHHLVKPVEIDALERLLREARSAAAAALTT